MRCGGAVDQPQIDFARGKRLHAIRETCARLSACEPYEMDCLHLEIESTSDRSLQRTANRLFSPSARGQGLRGRPAASEPIDLLMTGDRGAVYSLSSSSETPGQPDARQATIRPSFDMQLGNEARPWEHGQATHPRALASRWWRALPSGGSRVPTLTLSGRRSKEGVIPHYQLGPPRTPGQQDRPPHGSRMPPGPGARTPQVIPASPYDAFFTGGGAQHSRNRSRDKRPRTPECTRALRHRPTVFIRLSRRTGALATEARCCPTIGRPCSRDQTIKQRRSMIGEMATR